MLDEHKPGTATAVLPAVEPEDDEYPRRPDDLRWRARCALLEVTMRGLLGSLAQVRFPVSGARLDLTGTEVTELEMYARGPQRSTAAYRAVCGGGTPGEGRLAGFVLRCAAHSRRRGRPAVLGGRRLVGELIANGSPRTVPLQVNLLDVREHRVLRWLTGPVRLPVHERRIGRPIPRIHLAAEFTR